MSNAPIGYGIVGLGLIAEVHARALAAVHGARLVGVASRSAEKTRDFGARHGALVSTASVAELAGRPDIQVICVTTPSGAHLEPALEAIVAGKHVVVEKPIEVTLERIDRMLEAADRGGVLVGSIFQGRFGAGAQALKRAVEENRFGSIALASVRVRWNRTPEYYASGWHGTESLDGGGVLMNQAIHGVDLLQWCLGLPRTVFGWSARRAHVGIESEDTVVASLQFGSGALGTIEASTAHYPGWARRVEIGGADGSAVLEDDRLVKWDFRQERPDDERIRSSPADPRLGGGAGSPTAISDEGHIRQLQDFTDAVRAGRKPAVDGREGRNAVAIVRAIYRSAGSGRAVELR
ncbi:MAG TPA: Gfo/Idh/MocA family oxidoreductase [Opitutaceae bacterium]|jgi:predicted dehydrogenase